MLYHSIVFLEIVFGLVNIVGQNSQFCIQIFWVDFLYSYLYVEF